jgi:ATP-dependent protease ClpP protease subunit
MSDLMKLLKREPTQFEVKAIPLNQCYQCVIDDVFEEVHQFSELVDYLNNAVEGDVAHIKISTPGGALHSIIPLMNAMRNTDAHIAMHVESDTASCGTILMMLADEVYINPYTSIMIHTASYGYYNHAGNMEAHVNHSTVAIKKLVGEIYKGFLTPEEILRVQDGLEVYLTDEDCYERFKHRNEMRMKEIEQANKPAKKPRTKRVKVVPAEPQQEFVE